MWQQQRSLQNDPAVVDLLFWGSILLAGDHDWNGWPSRLLACLKSLKCTVPTSKSAGIELRKSKIPTIEGSQGIARKNAASRAPGTATRSRQRSRECASAWIMNAWVNEGMDKWDLRECEACIASLYYVIRAVRKRASAPRTRTQGLEQTSGQCCNLIRPDKEVFILRHHRLYNLDRFEDQKAVAIIIDAFLVSHWLLSSCISSGFPCEIRAARSLTCCGSSVASLAEKAAQAFRLWRRSGMDCGASLRVEDWDDLHGPMKSTLFL